MFNKYYQSELTYLRELGLEFSAAHPELANVFAAKGGDPDVERLLEGFAFLTARIRGRIDDAVPELVESLGQLVLPHYVRTLPAASIVEFSPLPNALRARHSVAAGTELASRPIEGTACSFRTTTDLDLLPLSIEGCTIDNSSSRASVIKLALRTTEAGRPAVFHPGGIRLHLAGALPQASMLFLWLTRYLRSVGFRNEDGVVRELGDGGARAPLLEAGGTLLPWPAIGMDGPRVLQEYFLLPESLLFVDLFGLDRVDAETATDRFELQLRFDEPPALPERLALDQLRINCVPVINLFDVSAEPIAVDPRHSEHLLRAAAVTPQHMEVYEVRDVVGVRANRRDRVQYTRFFDFDHTSAPREQQAYYTVRRALSPIDSGLDTYLSVMTPRDVPLETTDETLSIALTCTNRMLPANLRVGDICVATPRSPTIAKFRNITGATAPIAPPLGSELYWRLLAHLGLTQRSLGEGDNLRALVALYASDGDQPQARANRARAQSIRSVRMSLARGMIDDAVARGIRTEVTLDETQFGSAGDLYLFAHALDALLGSLAPINGFNQLQVKLHPSLTDLSWPLRNGTHSPF